MLQKIRAKSGSIVIKIILALIGASFVVWGIADIFRIMMSTPPIAKINNSKISFQEFYYEYQTQLNRIQHSNKGRISEDLLKKLPEFISEQMIKEKVFNLELEKLGIIVQKNFAKETIRSIPDFYEDGKFSVDIFNHFLKNIGMSQKEFIENINNRNRGEQLHSALFSGVDFSNYYKNLLQESMNDKRAMKIAFTGIMLDDSYTDEELNNFFNENSEGYKVSETRNIKLFILDYENLKKNIVVSEEDLLNEFEMRKSEFTTNEQRMVLQLSFESEHSATLAKKLIFGKTKIEEVMKKFPDCKKETIGMVEKNILPVEIADNIFEMDVGGCSGIVRQGDRYNLYTVTEIIPSQTKSIKDIELKKILEEDIKGKRIQAELNETKNKIEDDFAGDVSYEQIVNNFGLKSIDIESVERKNAYEKILEKIGNKEIAENLQNLAFDLEENMESQFVDCKEMSVMVKVVKVTPEHVPDLNSIKSKVSEDCKREKRMNQQRIWLSEKFGTEGSKVWKSVTGTYKMLGEKMYMSIMDIFDENYKNEYFSDSDCQSMFLMKKGDVVFKQTKNEKQEYCAVLFEDVIEQKNSEKDKKFLAAKERVSKELFSDFRGEALDLLNLSIRNEFKITINEKSINMVNGNNAQ